MAWWPPTAATAGVHDCSYRLNVIELLHRYTIHTSDLCVKSTDVVLNRGWGVCVGGGEAHEGETLLGVGGGAQEGETLFGMRGGGGGGDLHCHCHC